MSHRTQITLEDEQYERLRAESARTGLGLAELVRRALDETYGSSTVVERERRLDVSFGAWAEVGIDSEEPGPLDALDGEAYVGRLRPGLATRFDR